MGVSEPSLTAQPSGEGPTQVSSNSFVGRKSGSRSTAMRRREDEVRKLLHSKAAGVEDRVINGADRRYAARTIAPHNHAGSDALGAPAHERLRSVPVACAKERTRGSSSPQRNTRKHSMFESTDGRLPGRP